MTWRILSCSRAVVCTSMSEQAKKPPIPTLRCTHVSLSHCPSPSPFCNGICLISTKGKSCLLVAPTHKNNLYYMLFFYIALLSVPKIPTTLKFQATLGLVTTFQHYPKLTPCFRLERRSFLGSSHYAHHAIYVLQRNTTTAHKRQGSSCRCRGFSTASISS